ncbi:MAG: hypothetical protein JRD89_10510 [Deltaproteobacteria bacterium]|nr:hypothetical protein [Deltaproteobacteria bacterium]
MKVRIDHIAYDAPTKRDHLMKVPRQALYISQEDQYREPRDDAELVDAFLNRSVRDGKILASSGIVCDACSEPIPYAYVWVLVLGGYPWGVVCERCRQAHWADKPAYVLLVESLS